MDGAAEAAARILKLVSNSGRPLMDGWRLCARLAHSKAELKSPELYFSSAKVLRWRASSSSGRAGSIEADFSSASGIFERK